MQAHRISRRNLDRARSRRADQQPEQAPVPIAVIPVRRSPNLEVGASNDPMESDADRLATQALSRLSIESDPGAVGPGSAGGPDAHRHGPDCEHREIRHGDHTDYVHEGHRHASHGDHYDEH